MAHQKKLFELRFFLLCFILTLLDFMVSIVWGKQISAILGTAAWLIFLVPGIILGLVRSPKDNIINIYWACLLQLILVVTFIYFTNYSYQYSVGINIINASVLFAIYTVITAFLTVIISDIRQDLKKKSGNQH